MKKDFIKSALFGVAVGDALGVPVEFISRTEIAKNPIQDMMGYGTYNLPPGTFSDDSSLTFCLAEALTHEFDLNTIAKNFVKWNDENYWTARGEVFDIGDTTRKAIGRLAIGIQADLAGGFEIGDNGNGSLMRILALVFYLMDKSIEERFTIIKKVSSTTHSHIHSVFACFYYLEFARHIILGMDKFEIYQKLKIEMKKNSKVLSISPLETEIFERLLKSDIFKLNEEDILSTGYVLHTLEASIWCLLTTNSYEAATLKAVNLGLDTDTTSAVTGGLAGLLYGFDKIPKIWLDQMARKVDIENLAEKLWRNFM